MNRQRLHDTGILNIAFSLRGSASGLSEPLTEEVAKEYEAYLDERLANWKPSIKKYAEVDELDVLIKFSIYSFSF